MRRARWAASRLRRLGWRDRALLIEALACLALARAAVVLLPFDTIARWLGERMAETPLSAPPSPLPRRIGWAVAGAALYTPWRSKCLEQAIAARAMLGRRGLDSTLYFGVVNRPFEAHAWLRVGELNVTGGSNVGRYSVVATFAPAPRR